MSILTINNWLRNNLTDWLLNNWLSNGWVSNNLCSLNWLVLNMLFNMLLRNIFYFWYINVLRNIFSNMFNLLIISVDFLNRLVMSLVHSLIFCNWSCYRNIFNSCLRNMFYILSFIRDLMLGDNWFIVSVCFLDWNVLNVWGRLRLGLLYNSCCGLYHNWSLKYCWLNNRLN